MLMLTDGLVAMLTRTIEKDCGSLETLDQVIVLSLERSRDEPWAGEVTCRAEAAATRAARMEALKNILRDAGFKCWWRG